MSLLDSALVRLLPAVPKPVVQLFSSRYIAGATLAEAVECVRELNSGGKMATVDVLGEEITREEETRAIAQAYRDVFAAIDEAALDSNVSVKLTALGLDLSYDLCRENLLDVVRTAAGYGNFVRIDMEDSSTTDDTLRLYRELREDGHENLGVVLQARLRRTLDDVHALADLRPSVRLCKGIYLEPGTIAFTDYEAVRANFVRCLDALLDAGCYVGVATHDEWLIGESLARISRRGLGPLEYELQMLLGVREERRDELVAEGHRLRVYVPFGEHWYGYSLRRLQENPAMAGTIAKATAGRVLRLEPMIWARAEGCRVTLADGRELLDLTGGFGVAALGHRNPRILEAWREQEVVHALGDLADAEVTVRLREALPRPAKLGVTGEDAVEIALRTALLATGRPGIVAFDGAYHGTGLLALAATGFERFREPFAPWLPGPVHRRAYGEDPGRLPEDAGCVIVEPVQGRAGSRVPPDGFLETLRRRCDEAGALLVVDSIFAGLGRVGEMWPGEEVADVHLRRQGARRRAAALGGALLPRRSRGGLAAGARGRLHAHARR